MLSKIVRRPLVFLVGLLAIGILLDALWLLSSGLVSAIGQTLLMLLFLGLSGASLFALKVRQPRTFLVRDGAFATGRSIFVLWSGGGFTVIPFFLLGTAVDQHRRGFDFLWFQISGAVLCLVLLPLAWYAVLGPFDLKLRPDGLHYRHLYGRLFVPWEAVHAAQPTYYGVNVLVGRAELVIGNRKPRFAVGADPGFTAWVINLYAARAADRAAIGTEEGLRQLRAWERPV